MDNSKACTKCSQIKPLSEFNKRSSNKSGLRASCRNCDAIDKKIYRANNPDKKTVYALLSEDKKLRKRQQSKNWNKANKAKRTLAMAKRRAYQKGNGLFLVSDLEISKLQSNPCFYCGNAGGEIDHVMPLTKGGTHSIGNLVPCCRTCNSSKNNQLLIVWKIKKRAG